MGTGGALFSGILATRGIVFSAARYPELFVLVMGFNMTLPMVVAMLYRRSEYSGLHHARGAA